MNRSLTENTEMPKILCSVDLSNELIKFITIRGADSGLMQSLKDKGLKMRHAIYLTGIPNVRILNLFRMVGMFDLGMQQIQVLLFHFI